MIKTYEAIFDTNNKGVYSVSLVEEPAMEGDFIALSKETKVELKTVDEEQRILIGLVLEPNKDIYRNQGGEEFNLRFSEETIKDLSHNFFKQGYQTNSSIEHADEVTGVSFVESWIVEDSAIDKSANFGFSYPKGSWVATMKVDDESVWKDYVKTGLVKGFSIDGFLTLKEIKLSGFKPTQKRDKRGRWSNGHDSNVADEKNIKKQMTAHNKYDGSTFSKDGENLIGQKGKYSVATFEKLSEQIKGKLTIEQLRDFVNKHWDLLNESDEYSIGTWLDPKTGITWLDIVSVTDLDNAMTLGIKHNQISIFDLENLEEISTGGTGLKRQTNTNKDKQMENKQEIKTGFAKLTDDLMVALNLKKSEETVEVKFGSVQVKDAEGATVDIMFDGEALEVGSAVWVQGEGEERIALEAGEVPLEDGRTLVIGDDSIVSEIKDGSVEEEVVEEEMAAEPNVPNQATIDAIKSVLIKYSEESDKKFEDLVKEMVSFKKVNEDLKLEVVELSKEPAARAIKSVVTQKNYSDMSNFEKLKFNRGQ